MKEHCVKVTHNQVGQFHWEIGGHVWQSTHGKGGDIHPEERNIVQRVCNICDSHK